MEQIKIDYKSPEPQDYIDLRLAGSLSSKSWEGAKVGLENSLFSVSLWEQDSLVGFGRIIGDKGTVYQIVDVVVDPAYQGNGLGKKIMNELVSYLEEHAYCGAYVSLIADKPANKLYEQFGFTEVIAHGSTGMYRRFKN